MKKQIIGTISAIVLLLLLCSGIFANIVKFFAWFFTLQYSQPNISIAGEIIVRVLTFAVSFGLVGVTFKALGCFNGKVMSFVYTIISILVGFVLSYIVWIIEQYIIVICIIFGFVLTILIACLIIFYCVKKKKVNKHSQKDDDDNEQL